MLPEKTFDTGELVLNYAEGPEAGPPLVLLHGLTAWWRSWEPLLHHLTPAWHVYAVDLRGHGLSGQPAHGYHAADYARDIVAFLDQRVVQPAVLLGHSLGAITAMATAPIAPDLVRALVLVDPPLAMRNSSVADLPLAGPYFAWAHAAVQAGSTYAQLLEQLQMLAPELSTADREATAASLCHVAPGPIAEALQDNLRDELALEDSLRQITCPILLLWGDWQMGSVIRAEDAAWFQALKPQAQLVQIPRGTHGFLWDQADVAFPHVHQFLCSL
jgi:pimeloyl-ACP methyl ester carboxylesterase